MESIWVNTSQQSIEPFQQYKYDSGISIDEVIIVPDFKTFVSGMVNYLDVNTLDIQEKKMEIEIEHMDGAGIFIPGTFPCSCQIRGGWLKGAVFPFDFHKFIEKYRDKYLLQNLCLRLEGGKNTIVDVLCTDVRGRKFCVEMQMEWSDAFQQRVLFNASKLYVSQAKREENTAKLQPVYSLNLINDIFAHDTPDFIHNYRIVHDKDSNKIIEGLHFTFIELPKFTPHSIADKRMMVLWLRFLTEINSNTKEVPADLLNDPEIGKP